MERHEYSKGFIQSDSGPCKCHDVIMPSYRSRDLNTAFVSTLSVPVSMCSAILKWLRSHKKHMLISGRFLRRWRRRKKGGSRGDPTAVFELIAVQWRVMRVLVAEMPPPPPPSQPYACHELYAVTAVNWLQSHKRALPVTRVFIRMYEVCHC